MTPATQLNGCASTNWYKVLSGTAESNAVLIALDVAHRICDPAQRHAAREVALRQARYPQTIARADNSLAGGEAGLALLCGYLDNCRPGEAWDTAAHAFLTRAVRTLENTDSFWPGLYSGSTGVAFAATALSNNGDRYTRLLGNLDDVLVPEIRRLTAVVRDNSSPLRVSTFDVVSGLSGLAAWLLWRDPHGLLEDVLDALVSLAVTTASGLPRWYTPPELFGDQQAVRLYPFGNLNCGLAHGIPGPLAALALAQLGGSSVPRQTNAIRVMTDWLLSYRTEDGFGVNWPSAVPLDERGQPGTAVGGSRAAWCYGSPGVSRALWLAGKALNDPALCEIAIDAVFAVLRRPRAERRIDSPTFCHGVAGLLQIVLRFANDTGSPVLLEAAADLVDQIFTAYAPDRPLGYADVESGGNLVDRVGLLDGAAGVAMVLLAAATPTNPRWDRMFLLA